MGNPRVVFFAVAFLASLGAVLGPSPAYGLACGDAIRTDTVLTADLGPCPGFGLFVAAPAVTLDLGGFTIRGSGGSVGVVADLASLTIEGPGTITNFGNGVRVGGRGVTVRDLNFTENRAGIVLSSASFPRIINNTIDGGTHGETGISVFEVGGAKIKGNVITGHSGSGIWVGLQSQSVIVLNSVKGNATGLTYLEFEPASITIRDNEFSDNTQDGVSITRAFSNLTLDLNTLNRNGGNGISVTGQAWGPLVIGDNVVDNNGNQGVALTNISNISSSGAIQVIDNEVLNNAAVDLFWDGTGTNNCWKFNNFGSSDPATLPACP